MRSLSTVNRLRSNDLASFWELRFRNGLVEPDLVAVGIDPRESAVSSPPVRQRGCNLDAALADLLVVCHNVRYRLGNQRPSYAAPEGKSTRGVYSGKFMRRSRSGKRGSERRGLWLKRRSSKTQQISLFTGQFPALPEVLRQLAQQVHRSRQNLHSDSAERTKRAAMPPKTGHGDLSL